MANLAWFANSASLKATIGATTNYIAALKNVTITPHFDVTELYAFGGIHRAALSRSNYSVGVNCGYAMWATDAEYILSSYLEGGYLADPKTTSVATDENLAGQREKVAVFDLTATIYDTTRAASMTATIYGVYFNDIPIEVGENSFISRNLSGKGESMAYYYVQIS